MARPRKVKPGVFPRKRADGTTVWDVRYRDEAGHNRSQTFYLLDSKKDAKGKEIEEGANDFAEKQRLGLNASSNGSDMTLGEFWGVEEHRKTIAREHELSEKTRGHWQSMWKTHIANENYGIAGKYLDELSKKQTIDSWLGAMADAGVGTGAQVRSLGVLSAILDMAVDYEQLTRNPIRTMRKKPSTARQRDIYMPEIEEIELLRKELLNHPNRKRPRLLGLRDATIVSLMAYEAMRPEELYVGIWAWVRPKSEELHIEAPKARRGKSKKLHRDPPLNAVVAEDLERWHLELGTPGKHSPIIPTTEWGRRPAGEHLSGDDWRDWRERVFKPALKRVADQVAPQGSQKHKQIMSLRPYDLRHCAISYWLAAGGKDEKGNWDGSPANPVDVADWAGHQVGTMWENYAHRVRSLPKVPIAEQIRKARAKVKVPY